MKDILKISLILLICFPILLRAGLTGKISGLVFDAKTQEPLPRANISLLNTYMGATTDLDGFYFIINIPPGTYELQVDYVGYRSQKVTDVIVYIDKTTKVNIELAEEVLEGEEIEVTAFRESKVDPDITSTRYLYSKEDIENTPGIRSVEDLFALQPDAVHGQIRSGRLGEVNYILDGTSIVDPYTNLRSFSPMIEALEQTEIVTSGFSAEYGKAMSGVVKMAMREGGNNWFTYMDITNDIQRNPLHDNIYGIEANDHWELLNNPTAWLDTLNGKLLLTYLVQTDIAYRGDSLSAFLAFLDYRMFYDRVGTKYKNSDSRLVLSAGGPLSNNLRLFISGTVLRDWEPLPYHRPLHDYQLMSNIAYQFSPVTKLKLLYTLNFNSRALRNVGWSRENLWTADYYLTLAEWMVNRVGLQYSHIINESSFLNLNLTYQASDHSESLPLVQRREYSSRITPTNPTRPPTFHVGGGPLPSRHLSQKNNVLSFDGTVAYQVTSEHLLKGGVQFEYYEISENFDQDWTKQDQGAWRIYTRNPYDGALYLQDKMEFAGMIANIGLRWDFYDYRTDFYADIFSPLRNPGYDPSLPYAERESEYDKDLAVKERTKFMNRLQPRVGISFPVSESSVFHFNYGQFFQRPGFRYIYYFQEELTGEVTNIGNPRLEPEVTTQYDVGVVNLLPVGIILDVSGYYKYVSNLIEQAIYRDAGEKQYQTFENRDYAKILGFYIDLGLKHSFKKFNLGFNVRYNWEEAKGKTSTRTESPTIYEEDPNALGMAKSVLVPPPEDVLMDFDRTHKAVFNLNLNTSANWGPTVWGYHVFDRLSFNGVLNLRSGRPYTDEAGLQSGMPFNNRLSMENDLRIRLSKSIGLGYTLMTLYLEGFNLLNYKEYDYWNLFNPFAQRRTLFQLNEGTLGKYPAEFSGPYTWSDPAYTYSIYTNPPRYFRWGIQFHF